MKRRITALLCVGALLLCGCLSSPKTLEERFREWDGYTYFEKQLNTGKRVASILKVDDKHIQNGEWIVPETVNGYEVAQVGYDEYGRASHRVPFQCNENIRRIVAPRYLSHFNILDFINSNIASLDLNVDDIRYYYKTSTSSATTIIYPSIMDIRAKSIQGESLLHYISSLRSYRMDEDNNLLFGAVKRYEKNLLFLDMPMLENVMHGDDIVPSSSLFVMVLPECIMNIDEKCFYGMPEGFRVYMRRGQEDLPIGLRTGWDKEIEVVWNFEDYLVMCDANGGSEITFEGTGKHYTTVEPNGKAPLPPTPTQEGKVFAGWYTDYAYCHAWDFDAPVTENTLLIAKWKEIN